SWVKHDLGSKRSVGGDPGSLSCLTTPQPEKSSLFPELSVSYRISLRRRCCRALPDQEYLTKFQGLNSRGSVEQVMKEVKKQGGLNAEIQSRIGHQLRAMYDDVVRQGVPDRFAELIRKLDGPEAAAAQIEDPAKNDGRD